MNTETLLERYEQTRLKVAQTQAKILWQEKHVGELKAIRESDLILSEGGIKAIGSNEEERKRTLTRLLSNDDVYRPAMLTLLDYQRDLLLAEAELDCIKFEMRLYEASLKQEENRLKDKEIHIYRENFAQAVE